MGSWKKETDQEANPVIYKLPTSRVIFPLLQDYSPPFDIQLAMANPKPIFQSQTFWGKREYQYHWFLWTLCSVGTSPLLPNAVFFVYFLLLCLF